jgi:hypothetical protein
VALYNASGQPRTGEAASTTISIVCLETGYTMDFSDGTFKNSSTVVQPNGTVTALPAPFANFYERRFIVSEWPRGHYLAKFSAAGGETYTEDFTVGLEVDRRLGYSASYDGTVLKLTLWVEENGEIQTDYHALSQCRLLDSNGALIKDLGVWDRAESGNGTFAIVTDVTLAAHSNFIFDCQAIVSMPFVPGFPPPPTSYSFPLRAGLQRP